MTENKPHILEITDQLVTVTNDDYSQALKLLGFLTFIANEGHEPLLSGRLISRQTYNRYITQIKQAGLGGLLLDVRLRQILAEMVELRFGGFDVADLQDQIVREVTSSLDVLSSHPSVTRSPSA